MNNKGESMNDKWAKYHETKQVLLNALNQHMESIKKVNVYNSGSKTDVPLNTSGDFILMNESMGFNLMSQLESKLMDR